jgi:Zn-dependent protease
MLPEDIGYIAVRLVAGAPIFLLAVILHEVAHGYAAYARGDPTAKLAGRLTLDPWKHLDVFGALVYVLTLLFSGGRFAFGWAKPVPVNPYYLRRGRLDFMLVSLAGPMANVLQLLAWGVVARLLVIVMPPGQLLDIVGSLAVFGVIINAVLLVFNLIPIPPLDGSRVLAWLLPEQHAQVLDRIEPFGIVIVFGLLWLGVFGVLWKYIAFPLVAQVVGWRTLAALSGGLM